MLNPPERFEQCHEENDDASDPPHHLLSLPYTRGSNGLLAITESILTDLFQLHAKRSSSSGHGMPGVGTGCLACIASPYLPGFESIPAKEWSECNHQQSSNSGWKYIQRIV